MVKQSWTQQKTATLNALPSHNPPIEDLRLHGVNSSLLHSDKVDGAAKVVDSHSTYRLIGVPRHGDLGALRKTHNLGAERLEPGSHGLNFSDQGNGGHLSTSPPKSAFTWYEVFRGERRAPFHLPTKVSVTRGVHRVHHEAAVRHGGVLGGDGDASLLLQHVAVHHALPHQGRAAVSQQAIEQGGLPVVDVRCTGWKACCQPVHTKTMGLVTICGRGAAICDAGRPCHP